MSGGLVVPIAGIGVTVALAAVTAAASPLPGGGATGGPSGEVPAPVPHGWTATGEEVRYGRENLWERINGAAELYLGYRFRELVVRDVERSGVTMSVSVFDMSDPLDAFGVYACERPADADTVDGAGAVALLQTPDRGFLLKSRFYVKLKANDESGEAAGDWVAAALRDVAARLPGTDALPAELATLPSEGRIPGTLGYWGAAFLGLGDLRGCLHADYAEGGREYRLFVMKPSGAFWKNENGRWTVSETRDGQSLFTRMVPYSGTVVLKGTKEQLLGVADLADVEQALDVLGKVGGRR